MQKADYASHRQFGEMRVYYPRASRNPSAIRRVNKEKAMKVTQVLKLAGVALIAATSINAWSQSSAAGGTQMASGMEASAPASPKATRKATRKANHLLEGKVRRALEKGGIEVSGVVIRARNGAVVLEGHVPDADQAGKAEDVAGKVAGVTSVKNALSTKEEGR
jgi:osmotically-inducible protein OsmY